MSTRYVYCGELRYHGHEPERLPIRFVWGLADYDDLSGSKDFVDVVEACRILVGTEIEV